MRVMPPLLELADMFNLILRRCRSSRADSDLVRGAQIRAYLEPLHLRCPRSSAVRLMLALLEPYKVLVVNPRCCCRHSLLLAESMRGHYMSPERPI